MTPKAITVERLECNRCFYQWWPRISRTEGKTVIPKVCPNPKCKSPYWNKKRVKELLKIGENKK